MKVQACKETLSATVHAKTLHIPFPLYSHPIDRKGMEWNWHEKTCTFWNALQPHNFGCPVPHTHCMRNVLLHTGDQQEWFLLYCIEIWHTVNPKRLSASKYIHFQKNEENVFLCQNLPIPSSKNQTYLVKKNPKKKEKTLNT